MTTDELLSYCMVRANREIDRAGLQCQNVAAAKRAREWLQRAERVRAAAELVDNEREDDTLIALPFPPPDPPATAHE